MNVKETDYYKSLYVLNSLEINIGDNHYEVKIWADGAEVYKNGNKIIDDNPVTLYKEGEVIMKLRNIMINQGMKIVRKITEDADSWYIQYVLNKDEKGIDMIHRSYFQDNGDKKPDWVESEIVDMSMNDAVELFTILMAEITSADVDEM